MVEAKQYVGRMIETMNEGFHTAVETGRRTNETMFRTVNECCKAPAGFEEFNGFGVKMMNEMTPVMQKNMDAALETAATSYKAGVDFVKTAFDVTRDLSPEAMQDKTRQMWDASFNLMRTGMDLFGKTGVMAMDGFTHMYRGMACGFEKAQRGAPVSMPKAGK